MSRKIQFLFILLAGLLSTSLQADTPGSLHPLPGHARVTAIINDLVQNFHYHYTELNDKQSSEILDDYLEALDPNRNFFTQEDIVKFEKYRNSLDDYLLRGRLEPAFEIFRVFNLRRMERSEHAVKLLDSKFDFSVDEDYVFDRSEQPWVKDKTALNELWRKRVKNDVLTLVLAKKSKKEWKKTLSKRYGRLKKLSTQFTAEDTYETFINTYLSSVEPHTSYFSPRASENFNINMSLSLEGIGAALTTVDDYTVVQRVIAGGPADLSDQLHSQDRIIGVAQGRNGEFEDIVGWRIDDVVQLIRGPKGTVVRLQILPKESGIDGPARTITLIRNKVKLEEQQAKSSVIEIPDGKKKRRIGVISIPTFYMDFAAYQRGDKDYRSTTTDTRALVEDLKKQNVEGIVIDLRNNGGGSLLEAISLTGLFIKSGPVVQVRAKSGQIELSEDRDNSIAYSGPMLVLVNHFSASASEIFAGAMQDYGRALIAGAPTFGKGTVQRVIDLNRHFRDPDQNLGTLKITVAQFFRVNGDSTQHRGVVPDIQFPNYQADDDLGERSLDHALPWANIAAANFVPFSYIKSDLKSLQQSHLERIAKDPGFLFLMEQSKEREKIRNKKAVSLLKSKREKERRKLETDQNERINHFRVSVGLKPQNINNDDDEDLVDRDDPVVEEINKVEQREGARILVDMLKLKKQAIEKSQKQAFSSNTMSGKAL